MTRVVVVTGASSGVGRAVAQAFGKERAKVGLIARSVEALEDVAREIEEAGGEACPLPLDVADPKAVETAADQVVERWGRLDTWVNDAMVSVFAPTWQIEPAEYLRVTQVNYLGFVHGTLAALKHMRRRDAGTIVQIGSALAYRSIPLQSAYCASKAAIRGFTDSLRCELHHEKSHVRISMLQLPAVNTPQFDQVRSRLPREPRPVGTIYQPEVIARAVLYAAERAPREMWLGKNAIKAIVGQFFLPGVLDRYLAHVAWDGQMTDEPATPRPDDVDTAPLGDRGAHGRFDQEAHWHSPEIWSRLHVRALGAGALATSALLATGAWALWKA